MPQETVMGPLLWNTYLNDLKLTSGHLFKYADDLTVFQSVEESNLEIYIKENGYAEVAPKMDMIKQAIEEINEWCEMNNMTLSLSKSRHMTLQIAKDKKYDFHVDGVT